MIISTGTHCPAEHGNPLRLKVGSPVSDGGWITEASIIGAGHGCTRSGQSMIIDYILVGSVCQTSHSTGSNTMKDQQCSQVVVNTSAVRVASAQQSESACDPKSGGKFAVEEFGSDHLPVGLQAIGSTSHYPPIHAFINSVTLPLPHVFNTHSRVHRPRDQPPFYLTIHACIVRV